MSTFTLAPLSSRLLRRLPGARTLETFATESTVVCGAEDRAMHPAVFPAGELDRVTGVHPFSAGMEDELHLTTRDQVHHTETIAWRLRNVYLVNGMLCNHRGYERLTYRNLPFQPARVETIEQTSAFCSSAPGNDYFAHFLLDDAATALLGKEFGQVTFARTPQPRTAHMLDYLRYFEVPYKEARPTKFRDLWVFTDHPQNSHRRERMQHFRTLLRKKFGDLQNPAPAYIRRGRSGIGIPRILENETEIETLLARRGFRIVDPETMSADELCRQLINSPLIVGVEGSHLAHGVLNLQPGGALLCIQPAAHFNAVFRGYCNTLDLRWGFVVAAGQTNRFRQSTKRLLNTIDQLLEQANTSC